jgi:phage FluMu gp28-like protein
VSPDAVKNQKLFPWQASLYQDVVHGPNKYGTLEKSRRVGGTWIMAIAAVDYALKSGHNVWFSSSDEKNGKEFVLYVRAYCEIYNTLLGQPWVDLKEATTESVLLPNGSRVSSLSSNPRALRGKDGLIILDEVALHLDQQELFRAAQGCVVQRGKLWLLSTHDGPATLFYQLSKEAEEGKPEWSHHRVTLVDAVNEGYALKFATHLRHLLPDIKKLNDTFIQSIRASCLNEDSYGQEYMCKPVSLKALINPDAYDALALWDVPDHLDADHEYRPLYVGIDVARSHDLTVLWVVEQYENPKATGDHDRYDYKTVCVHYIKNEPIPVQYERLKPILSHPSVSGIAIDQGTVGRALADAVADDFQGITTLCNFHNNFKARIAERLSGYVQYQRISFPKDDVLIRTDLLALRREISPGGNVTYNGKTRETHCDFFWSAALAVEAACIDQGQGAAVISPTPESQAA